MPRRPLKYTTKTQALSAQIAKLARQMGPGARLPTMQQLSEQFDVSVMTINRALSELEAQGMLTRVQGSGTYVADRVAGRAVGLIYDQSGFGGPSPFRSLLIQQASQRAESGNEKFSLFLAEPSPSGYPVHDDLVDALQTRKLSGLLYAASGSSPALPWLLEQEVPLVALGYRPVAPFRVRLHHAATAKLGVEALAAKGCSRIALWIPRGVGIGRAPGATSFEELEAFQSALQAANLKFQPELVFGLDDLTTEIDPARASDREQGRQIARQVFAESNKANWPDGVVSLDDEVTYGALVEFAKLSVRLGKDVQIATHANKGSEMLWGYEDDLTLLEFDPADVAGAMFALLETLMNSQEPQQPLISVAPQLREK